MQVSEMIDSARDALTVKRVFGEPFEKDGVTIIPAAKIGGGAGGGGGDSQEGSGSGAGFGLSAKPAGAYVVRDGDVTWQPALDVNRIIMDTSWTVRSLRSCCCWLSGRFSGPEPRHPTATNANRVIAKCP